MTRRLSVRLPRVSGLGLVVAVAAATAVLSGCDSSSGGQGNSANTVSMGIDSDPVPFGYDPATLSGGGVTTFFQALYGSLFTTTSAGKVEPQLATGYEFNADKTELTLTLRQNVKFTDGTTLTSTLVKDNLDRRDPSLGAYGMFAKGGSAEILNVAAPDPSTSVITFASPQASAPSLLADAGGRIVGGKAIDDPAILRTGPDGSGPYTLSSGSTVKGSTYTLVKNESAWNAKSYPYSTIVFKVLTDPQARANALASGQVQIAQLDQSTVSFAKSKASVAEFSGAIYGFSLFDKLGKVSKPFASVEVRQALSMAIDRGQIAKLHTDATATASYFPPGTAGYEPSLESTYSHDPARAKQLLAEAGYPDGFSFKLLTAGLGNDADLQAVQKDWQAIGVTMTIQHVTSYAELLRAQTTTPMGYSGFTFGHDPLTWVYNFLLGGTFNAQHASDPKIQSALQAVASGGGNSDVAALKKLNAAIVDQGWSLPLYVQPVYVGYNSSAVAAPGASWDNVYPLLSGVVPAKQSR